MVHLLYVCDKCGAAEAGKPLTPGRISTMVLLITDQAAQAGGWWQCEQCNAASSRKAERIMGISVAEGSGAHEAAAELFGSLAAAAAKAAETRAAKRGAKPLTEDGALAAIRKAGEP